MPSLNFEEVTVIEELDGQHILSAQLIHGPNGDLLGPAIEALLAQKTFTFLADNEVFQNPRTGERWAGDAPIRKTMWTHALKLAKVRYRNPYQTRHTYASMMLSAGEHPMLVAQQMGHRDWGMIRKIYGRFLPEAQPSAGEKAEATFAPIKVTSIGRAENE